MLRQMREITSRLSKRVRIARDTQPIQRFDSPNDVNMRYDVS